MKKIISLSTVFVAVMILFASCGKYEEGPLVSLRSKEARVAGTYQVVDVLKNGQQDETALELSSMVQVTFEKDGIGEMSYTYTWGGASYTESESLEWMFNDDETDLMVRYKGEDESEWGDWETIKIIRLTDTEIWTEDYENDDVYEYHYEEI